MLVTLFRIATVFIQISCSFLFYEIECELVGYLKEGNIMCVVPKINDD